MLRCLNGSIKMANIAITDETGCKSSLIRVYTFCHFKATIYTPYIARVKKYHTVPSEEVRSGLFYLLRQDKVFKKIFLKLQIVLTQIRLTPRAV